MITIVYLDDSELALDAVKDGLQPYGFAVITHRNPVTIYAALARAHPALLLLDANMPTLDGRTICALVKRHMKTLPIVLFSSLSADELKALVAQCGADGYITKSGDYDRIAAELTRLVPHRRRTPPSTPSSP
jgi:DNA-binding response OmpR family regulator